MRQANSQSMNLSSKKIEQVKGSIGLMAFAASPALQRECRGCSQELTQKPSPQPGREGTAAAFLTGRNSSLLRGRVCLRPLFLSLPVGRNGVGTSGAQPGC